MRAPHALTAVPCPSEGARMQLAVPPDTEAVPPLLLAHSSGPKDLSRLLTTSSNALELRSLNLNSKRFAAKTGCKSLPPEPTGMQG